MKYHDRHTELGVCAYFCSNHVYDAALCNRRSLLLLVAVANNLCEQLVSAASEQSATIAAVVISH